jgi:hypothetical protein
MTPEALLNTRTKLQREGAWSIEWRAASGNALSDGRHVGLLFFRADVERVAQIRRRCRCTIRQAVRIHFAISRDGPL